ncbi:MAG TPA: hypothetical protein VLE53_18220 [Gemmatimonadaceae bacterium]|nr:hypothetical protein [Gemmatimonadaceae bacterium]
MMASFVVAAALACELEEVTIPSTASVVIVHGLLNSGASFQSLLLERSWNGEHFVVTNGPPYTPGNPIGSGSGYPELGATVEVTLPDGATLRGLELQQASPDAPPGIYALPIPAATVAAGGRFRLEVLTADGELLRAETTAPVAASATPLVVQSFDRRNDTLRLEWPAFAGARGYELRVETPYGPYTALTGQQDVHVSGALRNVFVEGLPSVFFPGFRQVVTISAVDSNFYDYFRTTNNFYSGRGLVSRVEGGLGVFGAITRAVRLELHVTAPFAQPIEGEYRYLGTPADSARTLVVGMTLWVDAKAVQAGQPDALSGAFRARPGAVTTLDTLGGMLGIRFSGSFGDSVRVAFLSRQSIRDTLDVFRAAVRGDTLVGQYRRRVGTWRFVRRPH